MTGSGKNIRLEKRLAYLPVVLLVTVLLGIGALFFILPKAKTSAIENRALAEFPWLNTTDVLNGGYTDSMNLYVSDHFPLRDSLLKFSFRIKEYRGIRSGDVAIIRPVVPAGKPLAADTTLADTLSVEIGPENEEGDLLGNGLFIYKGMALQLFGGSEAMAKFYASAINKYYYELKGAVNIYSIVFPTPSEFYLPQQYRKLSRPEKPNIDFINQYLDPAIRKVDAYSEFLAHQDEYLYYRTDHHATVLGGYYAYVAFCKTVGVTPLSLSKLQRKFKKNYLGSLYAMTHDERLKERPDTAYYYLIPGEHKTSIYYEGNQRAPIRSQLISESSWGYTVFLGGDHPLMKVETKNKNGRKALVVKNSYGNSFVPFLVPHFETVYAVDYRSFNLGLLNFIAENKITDLIFINCTILANSKWHTQCIKRIMYYRNIPVKLDMDSTRTNPSMDSIKIVVSDTLQ